MWLDRHPHPPPVNVHCCLPPLAIAQVHRALPPPHRVTSSTDWQVLLTKLRDRTCDVAIIDPAVSGDRFTAVRLDGLEETVSTGSPIPILGYVSVTAASIKAAHTLARLGASDILVRGLDDAPATLLSAVRRVVTDHAAIRLVTTSTDRFATLPSAVANAITTLFRRPELTRSVADLAATAGTTRRSLDRHLARAGLAPGRTLLACARANAAYHLLAAGATRPSHAALLVGYASSRALAREFRTLTGHVPSAVPRRLTSELFSATVSRRLLRSSPP
jgi:AraC-like DNA-binding protein